MKIIITIFLLASSIFASGINFEKSLAIAKEKALTQNKKIMIMYSTPTCPECNYMKKKVFKDKEIISYVNDNYISVVMDIKEDKDKLPFDFIGIPTFYFTDKNMNLLAKKIGGSRESEFLETIKSVK
ncbi:thioredoxin family protein [Halarcobacter ebronensis]|uniref:Thioredoxin family protein n=1 Tax=Halarcobacter ebronensis TaxID=1462615 RepID=A0A4Q0YGI5_9BACT|nr:thioredoxin fold domain-containing protein [Halarcobacter ebronensis]RXJ68139.1 thioredoxin family protein [Halarcobacter ebronensis]